MVDEQAKGEGRFIALHANEFPDNLVMLQRTRRQHINLIKFDGEAALRQSEIPPEMLARWGVFPGEEGKKKEGAEASTKGSTESGE
jgi:hypothetical protein